MESYHMELSNKLQIYLEWTDKLFQIFGDEEENLLKMAVNVQHRLAGTENKKHKIKRIKEIPLEFRTTLRTMAEKAGVSKSIIYRYGIKPGLIKPHTSQPTPILTSKHVLARLEYCMSMLEPSSQNGDEYFFKKMENIIHVDEKWFYLVKSNKRFYLWQDEKFPHRVSKNKCFVTKVMFLACVARPRFDSNGNCVFDGKVKIFPFRKKVPAERSSINRPAGTLETKPITVTRDVTRRAFIEELLPAIRSKWPSKEEHIVIQQDNARPHVGVSDQQFVEASARDDCNIQIKFQPANSPDLNILDLGFFSAIQSLQQIICNTIDELIAAVHQAFSEYPVQKLEANFLTLQSVMLEVMKSNGGNEYNLLHLKKDTLRRSRRLPRTLTCPSSLFKRTEELIGSRRMNLEAEMSREDQILEEYYAWEREIERQQNLKELNQAAVSDLDSQKDGEEWD
jgi:hypothetical protein